MSDNIAVVSELIRSTARSLKAGAYSFGVVAEFAGQLESKDLSCGLAFYFYKQVGEAVSRGAEAVAALADRLIINAAGELDFSAPVIDREAVLDVTQDFLIQGQARLLAGDNYNAVFMTVYRGLENAPVPCSSGLAHKIAAACRAGDLLTVELVINDAGALDFTPTGETLVITTHGGMRLKCRASHVTATPMDGAIAAEWEMSHGLIRSQNYFYRVTPDMVKDVRYVA